jgi:hypothetical protein
MTMASIQAAEDRLAQLDARRHFELAEYCCDLICDSPHRSTAIERYLAIRKSLEDEGSDRFFGFGQVLRQALSERWSPEKEELRSVDFS